MKLLFVSKDSPKSGGGGREIEVLNSLVVNKYPAEEILKIIDICSYPRMVYWFVSRSYQDGLLKLIKIKL